MRGNVGSTPPAFSTALRRTTTLDVAPIAKSTSRSRNCSGPWKCRLPDYQALEHKLDTSVKRFYGLPPEKTQECKEADWIALMVEGRALLPSRGDTMIANGIPERFGELADQWIAQNGKSIFSLTPAGARTSFLHRYEKLAKRRK